VLHDYATYNLVDIHHGRGCMRAAQFILFLLVLASAPIYADWQLNLTPGVSPISHDIYDLHMTIFWICVVIGIGVFGTMFYSMVYHRKSRGAKPAKFHEHLWVELTWTIVPLLILMVMAIPATRVLIHMHDESQSEITIKITGFQWKWKYEYLEHGINFFSNTTTPFAQIHNQIPKDENYLRSVDKPLVLPIHKKIRFLITSNDVIHSWWMPAFGVKNDAVPGFINEGWTIINRAGIYYGQCAELCGIGHGFMPIVVIAMTEKDFNHWVAIQKGQIPAPILQPVTAPVPTTPAPTGVQKKLALAELMKRGEQLYLNTCSVCHQQNGEGLPPTFPALKGNKMTVGPLDQHLNRVLNGKPGTAMQAFKDQFSDEELAAVITYERNAWGNNTGDAVQPEQVKMARTKAPMGE
jgi:cytochrome c oxidase subunit 2